MTAESESPNTAGANVPEDASRSDPDSECGSGVVGDTDDTVASRGSRSNSALNEDDDDNDKVTLVDKVTGVQEIVSSELNGEESPLNGSLSADSQDQMVAFEGLPDLHAGDVCTAEVHEVSEVQTLTLDALVSLEELTPVEDLRTTRDFDENGRTDESIVGTPQVIGMGGSPDESTTTIDLDERARTPEPTDSDLSLLPDDEEETETIGLSGRPTTEGFLHTSAATHFDRASLNSSCSSIYSRGNIGCHQGRHYSLYQGKNAFESLINSSAERVLEKIKTRTIDLEPLDSHPHRKMAPPVSPRTPPLVPAKVRPRKLEPIRTISTDMQNCDPFGAPLLTPLPPAK